jgi:LacI family transcriptional regulator
LAHSITMADVAREAGVSLMTVSRVVNKKGEVSQATRRRVQAVIEKLGYRPSSIARGLVTKRTSAVGLVVPDNANPFFSELARGAERVAYGRGYSVFLCNTDEDPERELAVLRSLEEKRVDGVILCSSRLDESTLREALSRHPASVLFNRRLVEDGVGLVLVDDRAGGWMVTTHLLSTGHRAVGLLAGPAVSYSGWQRSEGYGAVLAEWGIARRPEWTRHCSPTVEGGDQAARELLAACPGVTAICCFNDLVAVGALRACAGRGLSVPDDLAIVGFDDIPLAGLVTPSLTTCRVSRTELGGQAMRLLLAEMSGCLDECGEVIVCPELVVRDSAP